jgi:polynucleotide 5'-hydroxyl-kinase GRC3/NOL9
MRYLLAPENTLIVRGPASFRLLNGEAAVLGAPLTRNIRLVVRQEKQLPIEARSEADLEITLSESGSVFEVQGSTIPTSWDSAVEALAEMEQGKVMVIGATDVGKSTLSTYLTNRLFGLGIESTVVDGDIGQADIGPPTTIGHAVPTGYVSSLVDLKPDGIIFTGHTTPSQVETKLIEGIRRLSDRNHQSLTIINTDGWVLDPEAVIYKIRMIEAIQPDLILGISTSTELQPILSGARGMSLRIEAPQNVLPRSRSDRREIRTAGYRRFLAGATTRTYALDNIRLKLPKSAQSIEAATTLDLKNLIVGLLDADGYLLQIGVLLGFERNLLRLHSRAADEVEEIELGHVKLSVDGVELGYLEL